MKRGYLLIIIICLAVYGSFGVADLSENTIDRFWKNLIFHLKIARREDFKR
jgi:hypothetical protein